VERTELKSTVSGSIPPQLTELLDRVASGERQAAEALLPLVYDQLRQLARSRMSTERAGHTLQPTALVHEAYMRLVGGGGAAEGVPAAWAGRAHFFHAAAEAMRRILIDHARSRGALKRGGAGAGRASGATSLGAVDAANASLFEVGEAEEPAHDAPAPTRVAFSAVDMLVGEDRDPADVLAIDEAICELASVEPHLAAVVRLRFFAGLSVDETAQVLRVSPRTVKSDWAFARAWLVRKLGY
jgi:RNA polymerase sigma factor (TIGR02999 family)